MKSPRTPKRSSKLFEGVPMYAVPSATLFDDDGQLKLHGVDLSVYLYCCRLANVQSNSGDGKFMFQIKDVIAGTGWSKRAVRYALNALQGLAAQKPAQAAGNKLIVPIEGECKRPFHSFSIAAYDGSPLCSEYGSSQASPSPLRKFLHEKRLWYDDIPCHLFNNLKALKGAPLAIALAAYQLAIDKEKVKFAVNFKTWREKAGIARESLFKDAWRCSEFQKLIHASQLPRDEEVNVTFYHPTKGTSLLLARSNAARRAYERELDRPISQYESEHNQDGREYTSGEITRSIQHFYPDAEINADGVLVVTCPRCRGTKGGRRASYPTLRFEPDKGAYGVMYCGADVDNRGKKCTYGKSKMSYHLLAERHSIGAAEAKRMYDDFIRELRSEQNDLPLEDLQAGVTSMSEMPSTPESLEERNARATEEFQKKWREQI
jgi:hypothetical protein